MTNEELEATITQLQQQVEFLTQALIAMLEGNWVGAPPSAEATPPPAAPEPAPR